MDSQTRLLLQEYYNIHNEDIPQQREKSKWEPENNFGFLLGIIEYGNDTHINEIHSLLVSNEFKEKEISFIDSMFDYYISPFYNIDPESCFTSTNPSSTKSAEDSDVSLEKELSHKEFKKAVAKRDGVCLFCWGKLQCEGAHIIASNSFPTQRGGLIQKHQPQNGLLLCCICHRQFHKLKRYVDVDDDKLVLKVINETDDERDVNYRRTMEVLKGSRRDQMKFIPHNRQAVESNGEMALYFFLNNPTNLPNRKALEFHKVACMIWRMAGGTETDEEYCSDEEEMGPVDTAALKRRFNVQN